MVGPLVNSTVIALKIFFSSIVGLVDIIFVGFGRSDVGIVMYAMYVDMKPIIEINQHTLKTQIQEC